MNSHDVLLQLKSAPWLARFGESFGNFEVLHASSMEQARESFLSEKWEAFLLMVRNRNYRDAVRADHARFKLWNAVAMSASAEVGTVSDLAQKALVGKLRISGKQASGFTTDIWSLLFEAEYADLCPIGFYTARLLPIWLNGQLPCGWIGPEIDERWAGASDDPLPVGKLLVF
jgi:hypothetical protein